MQTSITPCQQFPDAIMRAILAVEAGQGETVILQFLSHGVVRSLTVWGAWLGDVFSWRMTDGAHIERPPVSHGAEMFAGFGDALDATLAAGRICWACAQMGAGEWSLSY